LKRRWGVGIAISTALAIVLNGGAAHAATESLPGETTQWLLEEIDDGHGGDMPIVTNDTYHEAYQANGIHTAVWRDPANGTIWMSYNNGPAYRISATAQTNVAPQIVAFRDGWAAFHTGTDHNIYWATSTSTPNGPGEWGDWTPIGGQTTAQTVSVTQPGPGSSNLLMAYRGNFTSTNDDQRLFWSWFSGTQWSTPQTMGGALSPSAPTVAWANTEGAGSVWAVHEGQNNHIYLSFLEVGSNNWANWQDRGGITHSSPQIAINAADDMIISHRDDNGVMWTSAGVGGEDLSSWSRDPTGWQSRVMAGIVAIGVQVFLLMTGQDNRVYYRKVVSGGIP
jgi:hypothetical protein